MPLGDTLAPLVSDPIRVRIDIFRDRLAGPDSANEVGNIAYAFFVKLFEAGGEHNRRPDGSPVMLVNGHHVAQDMATLVKAEWERRLRPITTSPHSPQDAPNDTETAPDMAGTAAADSGASGAQQ